MILIANVDALVEAFAETAHESWSGWTAYMLDRGTENEDGTVTIPLWAVERWRRQMTTAYADLTEEEKKSDRDEAAKYIDTLKRAAGRDLRMATSFPTIIKTESTDGAAEK